MVAQFYVKTFLIDVDSLIISDFNEIYKIGVYTLISFMLKLQHKSIIKSWAKIKLATNEA